MDDKFNEWHQLKRSIDGIPVRPDFHVRDIWYCYLGKNIGDEENGVNDGFIRPVIILRSFNAHICWVLPLTSKKKNLPYYFEFKFAAEGSSTAILSQVRLIDTRRLVKKIGFIAIDEFELLKEKFRAILP
ncbi:MAG: type II toxin-antitoxin system PemK/MazF family toxin [Patescibacteria group bacterium]